MAFETRWFGVQFMIGTDEVTGEKSFVVLWWKNPGFRSRCWCYRLPKFLQR